MKVLSFDIGTRTLSYCMLEHVEGVLTVCAWETIDVHAEAGLSEKAKPTMKEDAEYVLDTLGRRKAMFWSHAPDAVIIEQQPAGGANRFSSVRMKSISHVVHGYFYALQRARDGDGMGMDGCIVPVQFVSPSSKLVGMDKGETSKHTKARQEGDRTAMGVKYRLNKQYAVDATATLLATMEGPRGQVARDTFEAASPKQDDLSDCFMLAYAFVRTTRKRKHTTPRERYRNIMNR